MTDSSQARKSRWRMLLILAGIAAPFLAASLSFAISHLDAESDYISTRTVCGVIVGQLIGLRRGNISGFLLGPIVGLAAGIIDMKMFVWLFEHAQWSISAAAIVPIWGAVIGIYVASFWPRWTARVVLVLAITLSDIVARWLWGQVFALGWLVGTEEYGWLIEATTYVPTSFLAVTLARRADRKTIVAEHRL